MQKESSEKTEAKVIRKINPKWIYGLLASLVLMIFVGIGVKEYRSSQLVGNLQYRFNMAVIVPEVGVTFVSYDPAESSILALPFPTALAINSRSSGEYSIASLYKLGSYKGNGGKFARQKIQGFMRVPIPGYLVLNKKSVNPKAQLVKGLLGALLSPKVPDSSLSRFDAAILLYRTSKFSWREVGEQELVRAAVIEKKDSGLLYHPDRLQEYVGGRLFDWGIGASGVTVAIMNASGVNGLGSDIADFLTNLGFDVVMVRSVTDKEILEKSQWQVDNQDTANGLGYIFQNLFGFDNPKLEKVSGEYRSTVLVRVGKDAIELF